MIGYNTIKALDELGFKKLQPFGSRVVGCATKDSDYDYLVLVEYRPTTLGMEGTDFFPDTDNPLYGMDFSSWRSGKVNLVFTNSEDYYNATIAALEFCTKYKVYDKQDRCHIHEVYRDATKFRHIEAFEVDIAF